MKRQMLTLVVLYACVSSWSKEVRAKQPEMWPDKEHASDDCLIHSYQTCNADFEAGKKKKNVTHTNTVIQMHFTKTCVTLTAYNRVDCFTLGKQTLGIIVESIPNTAKIHGNEMERFKIKQINLQIALKNKNSSTREDFCLYLAKLWRAWKASLAQKNDSNVRHVLFCPEQRFHQHNGHCQPSNW